MICNFLKLCPDGPVCALTLKYLDFTVQLFSLVLNYPKSAPEPGTKPTVAPIRCPRDQCYRTVSGCLGLLASFHVSGLSPSGCCCFNSAKVQNSILKKTRYKSCINPVLYCHDSSDLCSSKGAAYACTKASNFILFVFFLLVLTGRPLAGMPVL